MAEPFKLIILPAAKVGMTRAELQDYLEFSHGPLVMKFPDVGGRFTGYEIHFVESEPTVRAGSDAVTIINFASMAEMIVSKASENYQLHVGPDEDNFRDEAESRAFSAKPLVIRDGPRDAPCKLLIFRRLRDATAAWESHVANVLGGGDFGVLRVVVNHLSPLGAARDYDILDEISLTDAAQIADIAAMLEQASESLLAGPSMALITRPKIFV